MALLSLSGACWDLTLVTLDVFLLIFVLCLSHNRHCPPPWQLEGAQVCDTHWQTEESWGDSTLTL